MRCSASLFGNACQSADSVRNRGPEGVAPRIPEFDNNEILIVNYTNGLGIDNPISMRRYIGPTTGDYFFHKNHQGSITEITNSAGNIAKMYKYDAYGKKIFESGPSLIDEPAYTARNLHDRSGLYYYRNHFYNPQIGRFISQDPIGHAGGMNLYAYTGNDPVNWVDPLGLWTVSFDFFEGPGGGLTFGKNPGGRTFLAGRYGYGIGGGVSYNPEGTSPGYNECSKKKGGVQFDLGGFAEANLSFLLFSLGYTGQLGFHTEVYATKSDNMSHLYSGHGPSFSTVLDGNVLAHKYGLRAGAAIGGEATIYLW